MKIKQRRGFEKPQSVILVLIISFFTVFLANCAGKAAAKAENIPPESSVEIAPSSGVSRVYFTADISPAGLMSVYEALGREANGRVAVKLHTGESPASNHLRPEFIKDFVQSVNGTIVESNTAYAGSRSSTAMHKQLAKDHGFTAIAPVDILDEDGEITLPVSGGRRLQGDIVGSHFSNYDFWIILSHFKGHGMGGFGGAIKNASIGIASSRGKTHIHTAGVTSVVEQLWNTLAEQDAFLESMAEAAKAVADDRGEKILYISVMNRLSVSCDCAPNPPEPDMHDIGILSSLDPVALDKACVDLVYAAPDGASLIERMESLNGSHTLDYAAEIGLGSLQYDLVKL